MWRLSRSTERKLLRPGGRYQHGCNLAIMQGPGRLGIAPVIAKAEPRCEISQVTLSDRLATQCARKL